MEQEYWHSGTGGDIRALYGMAGSPEHPGAIFNAGLCGESKRLIHRRIDRSAGRPGTRSVQYRYKTRNNQLCDKDRELCDSIMTAAIYDLIAESPPL